MKNRAFTLVELVVVIGIIAILTSAFLAIITGQRAVARDKKRLVEIDSIRKALELYYADEEKYPQEDGWCCIGATIGEPEKCVNFPSDMESLFPSIPRDPLYPIEYDVGKRHCYHYISTSSNQIYKVHVRLESGTDYQVYSKGGKDISLPYQ